MKGYDLFSVFDCLPFDLLASVGDSESAIVVGSSSVDSAFVICALILEKNISVAKRHTGTVYFDIET